MKRTENEDIEILHRLVNRISLDRPSENFTVKVMEKVKSAQITVSGRWRHWVFLFGLITIVLASNHHSVWQWLGIEFTPLQFFTFYASHYIQIAAQWLSVNLKVMTKMGFLIYLIPVSVALVFLSAFDQVLLRKRIESMIS